MRLKCLFLLFFILTCSVLCADKLIVSFKNLPDTLLINKLTTFSVLIENTTQDSLSLSAKLILPEKWLSYSTNQSINILAGNKTFKLCSFKIPATTRAGKYLLKYELYDSKNTLIQTNDLSLNVPLKKEFDIDPEPLKNIYLSGDSILVSLKIKNLGNIPLNLSVNKISNKIYTLERDSLITVSPASEKLLKLKYITNKDIYESQRFLMEIPYNISFEDNSQYSAVINLNSQIIPVKSNLLDYYNYLSINARNSSFYNNNEITNSFSLNANAFLNSKREYELRVNYQNNDMTKNLLFNDNTRSSIMIYSRLFQIIYGDNSINLESSLLPSYSGRGESVAINTKLLRLKLYHLQDNYNYSNSYASSIYLRPWGYSNHWINTAFIDSSKSVNSSLKSTFNLSRYLYFDNEFALKYKQNSEQKSTANDISLTFNLNGFSFFNRYAYQPNTYTESNTQKTIINNRIYFTLLNRNVDITHELNKTDIKQKFKDTTQNISLNFNINNNLSNHFSFQKQTSDFISSSNHIINLKDEYIYLFDYNDNEFKQYSEFTYKIDKKNDINTLSQIYALDLTYTKFSPHSIKSSLQYNRDAVSMTKAYSNTINTNVSVEYILNPKMTLSGSLNYSQYLDFNHDWNLSQQNAFIWNLTDNYLLSQSFNWKLSSGICIWSTTLSLSYNNKIPLTERKDLLRLKGRLTDQNMSALEGKILVLNNRLAITNKTGEFIFPGLNKGKYTLELYNDENYVYQPALPLDLFISPDSLPSIDITRLPAAKLTGQIQYYKPVDNWFLKKEPEFYLAGSISGAKIILNKDNQEYVSYSDSNGNFSFDKLPAGSYLLKIDPADLPDNYIPDWLEKNIVLESGVEQNIKLELKEKLKRVKFKKIGE